MRIRKAEEKDIPMLLSLLSEILELHARIRPDIFIPGTTKYTESELKEILKDEDRPIFAAVTDDTDEMLGYAFCVIQKPSGSRNIIPFESVYIDDLCVTEKARGQGIGKKLFEYAIAIGISTLAIRISTERPRCQIQYFHALNNAGCFSTVSPNILNRSSSDFPRNIRKVFYAIIFMTGGESAKIIPQNACANPHIN